MPDTEPITVALVGPTARTSALQDVLEADDRLMVQQVPTVTETTGQIDCLVAFDGPEAGDQPAADGLETVERAPETEPVVVYTEREGHERIQQSLDRGAADVIRMPLKHNEAIAERVYAATLENNGFQPASRQLASLLRNYPHTLFIKDSYGRFANVTTHTAGNYGFAREEMIGLTDYELFEMNHADSLYEEEQEVIRTGNPIFNKIEGYVDRTGTRRWSSTTRVPRYDDSGTIIGIVGGTRDVTAAKRQEEMMAALHDTSRELSRVKTKREIADIAVEMAGDISLFTGVHVALTTGQGGGLESVASTATEWLSSVVDRHGNAFETAFETGDTQYIDEDGIVTDDQSEIVETTLSWQTFDEEVAMVVPLGSHGAIGLGIDDGVFDEFTNRLGHVLASNVTAALDRSEREQELTQKKRQIEEFATLGSHELRNRLQIALACIVQERAVRESDRLEKAEQTLEEMDRLLHQVLQLARSGRIPQTSEAVDFARAVQRAWDGVHDDDTISLEPPASQTLLANPDALTELLQFLFQNTAEHAGSDVTVTVGRLPDGTGFYVEDDGVGIPEDRRPTLFDVDYAHAADNTGYGLYIVSAIVEAHGWEITVGESEAGGARFEITGVNWT